MQFTSAPKKLMYFFKVQMTQLSGVNWPIDNNRILHLECFFFFSSTIALHEQIWTCEEKLSPLMLFNFPWLSSQHLVVVGVSTGTQFARVLGTVELNG